MKIIKSFLEMQLKMNLLSNYNTYAMINYSKGNLINSATLIYTLMVQIKSNKIIEIN